MSVNAADFNDPINLQVMWNRLIFIADQADIVLGRTAFSPIVRENHDYVTVLLDSRGRALAQCTWSIPVFITSLPVAAQKYFLPRFPAETLEEGDVLATNDPEIGTGHLPDVTMITPIFKNGKVVAYAGSIAHLPDIGGAPLHSEASDIFEEGIRFPIVKLHKAGVPNKDVLYIIAASVRLPTEVMGDLESMVAANNVMGRELVKFLDEYDLDSIDELADAIHTRSEAQTRRAIRQWPNGTYSAEVLLDGYDTDVTLKASVIVRDDSIHVDYAGTSDQVLHSINCRTNYRYAHSVYALKCLLDPDTPNNEGCITPITDEAPLGSILNPEQWTAGNSRNLIGHVIPSLIFKALEGRGAGQGDGRQRRRADLGRQLRRPARRRFAIRLGAEFSRRAGRPRRVRRSGHAELPVQLQGHRDRDVRDRRPRAHRVQGADSGFRRRRQKPGRAWPARHLAQSRA
ncbi:N-methylhydantoinase B/oxoprolinase/acetone carboxylase alpha subunit [Bradyrhizobium diazoefficiens]